MRLNNREVVEFNAKYLLHPMTAPSITDNQPPMIVERGDGVYVFDHLGKRYLDTQAGLWCVNVGHNRTEMKQAINDQLDKIAYYTSFVDFTNAPAIELSKKLIDLLTPEKMKKVMFSSGGSDANETALKLARQYWKLKGYPERTNFISLRDGYHGTHFGAGSVSGADFHQSLYEPALAGCVRIDSPFLYRNSWSSDPAELGAIVAGILKQEICRQGAHTVAAFIVEPILGAGGVIIPPNNFLPLIREVCDKYDVLLIVDEVVTGFGRSGKMFGIHHSGVKPDMMTFAKGLTSGYVPLGATVINERMAEAWSEITPQSFILHGQTYCGHPLACAAGIAAIDIVEKEGLSNNADEIGQYCLTQLRARLSKYSSVGEIRGQGLMIGIDLVQDKSSRSPFPPTSNFPANICRMAEKEGVIVRCIGSKIILSPPLIFNQQHVHQMINALDAAFEVFDQRTEL